MAERRDEVPFKSLEPTRKKGKYFEAKELAQDPDLIVKEARTKWGFFETEGVHPLNDLERTKEDLTIVKDNFAEFIPETNLVVGKNQKGKEVVYIVQDKIHGQELTNVKPDEEIASQLRAFLEAALKMYIKNLYYRKNAQEPSSIFPDIKGWNFIVGRNNKIGEQKDRLYFVDTYPTEGSPLRYFLENYIPNIVRPTFPEWCHPVIDEFRLKAAKQLEEYIKQNNTQIPRVI